MANLFSSCSDQCLNLWAAASFSATSPHRSRYVVVPTFVVSLANASMFPRAVHMQHDACENHIEPFMMDLISALACNVTGCFAQSIQAATAHKR